MSADRPKLGDVFRGPDRASGLGGLLPDSGPRPLAPAPAQPALAAAAPEERPGPRAATTQRRAQPIPRGEGGNSPDLRVAHENTGPAAQGRAVVPVVLDASILADLREFGRRTDQTHGAVTLRAIEANAGELAGVWAEAQPAKGSARLFRNSSTTRRRAEVGVQTQLRIEPSDAATLDQLVTEWAAPSRSALVNEALRRYVRPATSSSGG